MEKENRNTKSQINKERKYMNKSLNAFKDS